MNLKAFLGIGVLSLFLFACAGGPALGSDAFYDITDEDRSDVANTGATWALAKGMTVTGTAVDAPAGGTAVADLVIGSRMGSGTETWTLAGNSWVAAASTTLKVGVGTDAGGRPFNLDITGAVTGAVGLAVFSGGTARNVTFSGPVTGKTAEVIGSAAGNTLTLTSFKAGDDDTATFTANDNAGLAVLNIGAIDRSLQVAKIITFAVGGSAKNLGAEINYTGTDELVLGATAADALTFDSNGTFDKQLFSTAGALTLKNNGTAGVAFTSAATGTIRTAGTLTAEVGSADLALGRVQNTAGGIVLTATDDDKSVSLAENSAGTGLVINSVAGMTETTTLKIAADKTLTIGTYTAGEAGA